ncbi:Planctomycete cytochrome C [Planctomycetes bacterium Pla163]|uniref:Planctomycete cytochrome C n=1 Tax=Rohdeia mirabilis TaxID=2528008 RepID=A0A518CXM4_9BACT|nr:Planctomycete cytochrome C [Planctomycetes bacterium Pla163]
MLTRLALPIGFLALSAVQGSLSNGAGPDDEPLDFSRDVQPILSRSCFVCHGPDEATREADLRLDLPEMAAPEFGIVTPGAPDESELVYRLTEAAGGDRMPPAGHGEPLDADEIALIRRWIAEGATFDEHWSFRGVGTPAAPTVQNPAWVRNPIDAFVLARLEREGLAPSPEADRATLLRRLSFDLTGMPPTPDQVAAFTADERPEAYDELVDRLLASDAYAERMTLAWMDAARYGDTSVHHADGPRDMWPWRDWVIAAYRENMPFDQFTVEQLAGDLLPDPTRDQLIASGFHRNSPTSDEGGAIDEELRVKYMVDRVMTTSNVWLGLSMECAQCHDHKYDPVSQTDYYRFYAYFNQSVEPGFQTRNGNQAPIVQVPTAEQADALANVREEIAARDAFFRTAAAPRDELDAWIESQRAELLAQVPPTLGDWYQLGPFTAANKAAAYSTDWGPEVAGVDVTAEQGGRTWVARSGDRDGTPHQLTATDNSAIYLARTVTSERAQSVAISLGSDDSIVVFLDGTRVFANDVGRGVAPDQDRAVLDLPAGESQLLLKIVNGGGAMGYYFRLEGSGLPDAVQSALLVPAEERDVAADTVLRDHFVRTVWSEGIAVVTEREAAAAREMELAARIPTVMVMEDLAGGRQTYVLDRGQYDAPIAARPVEPGVLEHVHPLAADAPANRLGLALWLTDPEHPLTARVAVNRYWAMLFGRGLVPTVMDFGSQGARPSHPELLDWLARDFATSGWDVKRALKQIVTSATYRQSSRTNAALAELDPENELLARASRFRLHGEFLRDQALAASGLLVERVGGPGVRPYQPDGLWNEVSLDGTLRFVRDSGEALYRKSLYTYWKRSAPMPSLSIFGTPIRDTCVIERQRTNTPLQALVTLNDVQFVEAARHLAERMMEGAADFDARLDLGFVLCTARPADELRRGVCRGVFDAQLADFREDLEAARALLAVGDSPSDPAHDEAELASWTVIASLLLNLDETLTRE